MIAPQALFPIPDRHGYPLASLRRTCGPYTHPVALLLGARLGPYEVAARIGAGGMGEVYRARDTKLDRDVALKVLPDASRRRRAPRPLPARSAGARLAQPSPHRRDLRLRGSGETHALVLELVEGETLADRIARGPLPLDEALAIARQIAEALAAAHEQGIIHRDLKPANIKVTADGAVKVLDFGLAKLAARPNGRVPATRVAVADDHLARMMTGIGVMLGTAAYMSPEQAKGREADKRSDIWAFGCVLYEMLAGRRPSMATTSPTCSARWPASSRTGRRCRLMCRHPFALC